MKITEKEIALSTKGYSDIIDITPHLKKILVNSNISQGLLTVFVPGSTGSVTTVEFESGVVRDLSRAVERLIPQDIHYDHDARWGDGNGFSHVRASLLGPSLSIPVSGNKMVLGTWQQVVFIDFDNRPRRRELKVQIMGNEN